MKVAFTLELADGSSHTIMAGNYTKALNLALERSRRRGARIVSLRAS
jgi:hypothetical protein